MPDQSDNKRPKQPELPGDDFAQGDIKAEISLRLKQAVKIGGGNKEVSAKSGVPIKTLGNLLGGQAPNVIQLVRLAEACEVSLDWLATGTLPVHRIDRLAKFEAQTGGRGEAVSAPESGLGDDYVLVPRYNVQASAGNGSVIYSEQVVDYLAFKSDWVRGTLRLNPSWLLLIEAVGDSMEGTISNGDLLLINTNEPRIRDNAVYALNVKGNLLVKRVQRKLDGSLVVSSDNPRYAPETIMPIDAENLRVIGQVIWHGGMMK
ncbi:MAG: S24 family peptidase [Rhodospirillaceae bacterium]